MGYYTEYNLKWPNAGEQQDIAIGNAIQANEEMTFAMDREGETCSESKWYGHVDDLKVFSLKFPGVLFTLSGEGEEAADLWKKYFLDGKVQVCKAVLDFPKFDVRLLK